MKMLIDITPEALEDIKNDRASRYFLENKILNGTLLPKGHGRLISEEDMLSVILFSKLVDDAKVGEVKEALLNIPTIIEAESEDDDE